MVRPRLAGGVSANRLSTATVKRIDVQLRMSLLRTSEAARLLRITPDKLSRQLTAARKRGLLPPAGSCPSRLLSGHIQRTLAGHPEAAADQYFLENGVSTVQSANLVGSSNYVKAINTVAKETYPTGFTQGITITIGGVAGARTVTYAP